MRRKSVLLLLSAVALLVAQREPKREQPLRQSVRGSKGAVSAGSDWAAEAGMRILHKGGSAVDAGVATTLAASVAEFSHFGFGGEAPILIRTKDGKVVCLAGVGTMPKLASAQMFRTRRIMAGEIMSLEPGGLKGIIPVAGLMPALVPGMVEGMLVALRDFGSMSFADVVAPALELADGMALDELRANYIVRSRRFFELWPTSKAVYLPTPQMPAAGDIFRQPDLARTLRSMIAAEQRALKSGASRAAAIDAVRDYFYRGEIARKIDEFSKANGGLLRFEDMAAFRIKAEEPEHVTYRGYTVYKPGFWSQGPVFLEALNMLEAEDLRALGYNTGPYLHRLTEILKLAYADRDTYYGDPAMTKVPKSTLLSKEYALKRRELISSEASMSFRPGHPAAEPGLHPSAAEMANARIDDALMARDTTGITVMDKDGVTFAVTPSGAWLPSVIAGDTGIPLTQRAQSFLLIPGHPNELGPGKRPRVTLSPTLVTREGKPIMALATPGGDNQDQALLQVFLDIVEFGMNAQSAIEAPRIQTRHLVSSFDNHAMNPGDLLIDERISGAVYADLFARGHKTSVRSRWNSGAFPVMVRMLSNGVLEAGADPYGQRVAHAW